MTTRINLACIAMLAFATNSRGQGDLNSLLSQALAPDAGHVVVFPAKKIITMEAANPEATAVAVSGGRIIAVGSLEEVKKALGGNTFTTDDTFAEKVVIPGLIDQHLHPILGALTLAVEVVANEDWVLPGRVCKAAANPKEYMARLRGAEKQLKDPREWFFSWGYHPLWHGKLDRKMLDDISSDRPIAIWHRSCHEFYLNSAALKALHVTEESTKGKGLWSEQADWPTGHFYEGGLNLIMAPLLSKLATPERLTFGLKQTVAYLHQNGVTAYNEPGALVTPEIWKLYQRILGADDTPMYSTFLADGRGIPDRVGLDKALAATEEQIALSTSGKVAFFPKQVKLFADGAIISQLMQMKDGYNDGHKGQWILPPEELEKRAKLYWDAGYRLHIHVNGDLGLQVLLDVLERRMRENPRPDHRTVIVHFANSSEQQVGRIARLGCIVSSNPYYPVGFADKFGEVGLGKERADAMVRNGSVVRQHIPLSFHSDLPMAPASPLFLAWCGVNRTTPSGRVAGPEQRISVEKALRAVTIEAAYSWKKEQELGSIAPGKIANFTILDSDPLTVAPKSIKDITVWGTVFEGRKFPVDLANKIGQGPFRLVPTTPAVASFGWNDRPLRQPFSRRTGSLDEMLELMPRTQGCGPNCSCGGVLASALIEAASRNLAGGNRAQ